MTERISGTREWAVHSMNCVNGCSHDCAYCYAKTQAARFKRIAPEDWHKMEAVLPLPEQVGKKKGRIMFPTAHDITPETMTHCVDFLTKVLQAGNEVLIVSKPHLSVIDHMTDVLKSYKDKILFRFTIGSADNKILSLWEPGAPTFEERLAALKLAFDRGFFTSVSCEPMLDDDIGAVVTAVDPYVTDSIWLGKMNKVASRLKRNNANATVLAEALALAIIQRDQEIKKLYEKYKGHPKIKWKESIKEVVGIAGQTEPGQDI
jgi:DNA repair photolyase